MCYNFYTILVYARSERNITRDFFTIDLFVMFTHQLWLLEGVLGGVFFCLFFWFCFLYRSCIVPGPGCAITSSSASRHHFPRRHPFFHIVTEHRAHVYQYEQHTRDAQREHGRFRRARFNDGDRLVCNNNDR